MTNKHGQKWPKMAKMAKKHGQICAANPCDEPKWLIHVTNSHDEPNWLPVVVERWTEIKQDRGVGSYLSRSPGYQ